MRVILIGLLVIVLFGATVVGTYLLLQTFDPLNAPSSGPVAAPTAAPSPSPSPTPEPTATRPPARPTATPAFSPTPVPTSRPTATPAMPLVFTVNANDGGQYRRGDLLVLTASTNQTCYLQLYDLDSQGTAARIFPSSFVGEPRLLAGEQRRIPAEDAGYDLPLEGPAGSGSIHAVCSRERIQGLFEVYQTIDAYETALRQHVAQFPSGHWAELKIPYTIQ